MIRTLANGDQLFNNFTGTVSSFWCPGLFETHFFHLENNLTSSLTLYSDEVCKTFAILYTEAVIQSLNSNLGRMFSQILFVVHKT
jgi:hypothetical protein